MSLSDPDRTTLDQGVPRPDKQAYFLCSDVLWQKIKGKPWTQACPILRLKPDRNDGCLFDISDASRIRRLDTGVSGGFQNIFLRLVKAYK